MPADLDVDKIRRGHQRHGADEYGSCVSLREFDPNVHRHCDAFKLAEALGGEPMQWVAWAPPSPPDAKEPFEAIADVLPSKHGAEDLARSWVNELGGEAFIAPIRPTLRIAIMAEKL